MSFSLIFTRNTSMSNIITSTMSSTVRKLAISYSISIVIVSRVTKIVGALHDLHHFFNTFSIFLDCAASTLVSVDSLLVVVARV